LFSLWRKQNWTHLLLFRERGVKKHGILVKITNIKNLLEVDFLYSFIAHQVIKLSTYTYDLLIIINFEHSASLKLSNQTLKHFTLFFIIYPNIKTWSCRRKKTNFPIFSFFKCHLNHSIQIIQ